MRTADCGSWSSYTIKIGLEKVEYMRKNVKAVLWIGIQIESVFNVVPGSVYGLAIRIQI